MKLASIARIAITNNPPVANASNEFGTNCCGDQWERARPHLASAVFAGSVHIYSVQTR